MLKNNEFVELFQRLMREKGVSKTGTYDRGDPTHYENLTAYVVFEAQYLEAPGEGYSQYEPVQFCIEAHDNTWGVEFYIYKTTNDHPTIARVLTGQVYFSREFSGNDREWVARANFDPEKVKAFLVRACLHAEWFAKWQQFEEEEQQEPAE